MFKMSHFGPHIFFELFLINHWTLSFVKISTKLKLQFAFCLLRLEKIIVFQYVMEELPPTKPQVFVLYTSCPIFLEAKPHPLTPLD